MNLDKKEYISPHKLGTGLKLWEQLANFPGTGQALIILTAAMPRPRGGGDFRCGLDVIGRWAGDRIAIVGDYAERDDLPDEFRADLIYGLCDDEPGVMEDWIERIQGAIKENPEETERYEEIIRFIKEEGMYTDISDQVCKAIEEELGGYYVDKGWRSFVRARPNLLGVLDEFDDLLEKARASDVDVPEEFPAIEEIRKVMAGLVQEEL